VAKRTSSVNIIIRSLLTADAAEDDRHIMISYQWDSKPTVLQLRDRLKEAGFRTWIDVENMCTYFEFAS